MCHTLKKENTNIIVSIMRENRVRKQALTLKNKKYDQFDGNVIKVKMSKKNDKINRMTCAYKMKQKII